MSHRPRLRVFAFNAGFLRDHMNGAFLVLWPLLERGGLGAPGQPVSREPLRADQADLRCLGLDLEENQPPRALAVSLPTKRGQSQLLCRSVPTMTMPSLLLKGALEVVFTLPSPCDYLSLIMGILNSILSVLGPLS